MDLFIQKRYSRMITMPMQELKVFCDLAACRNFSKAAEVNGLSQPTVSRILQHLETRLGGPLIDRSRRPLRLTPLGQAYYEGCKRLLDSYAELESSLTQNQTRVLVTVQVAAIYSVGLGDMGLLVERYEAAHPHVRIQVDYLHPDQVYERVHDGVADFGLVSFPSRSRDLTVLPWREENMVVVCAAGHPLASLPSVPPAQLEGEKYVAFEKGLAIRSHVDRFLEDQGVNVEIAFEFDNIENIKKGIEVGSGIALLPEPTIRQEREAGRLLGLPLEGCRFVRPLGIIHRRHHQLCSAALGFLSLLRPAGDFPPMNGEANGTPVREAGPTPVGNNSRGATRAPGKKD
jgi:DNA-binding transcriptional LysR family regulator